MIFFIWLHCCAALFGEGDKAGSTEENHKIDE